ncbi:acyltransferase family protein [Actinoplanes sp. HUAS TT8]|uniref:acyltransferase family protein n=1 Tax=Actinoplanes sp. HUAS TT8 TaxID=3447453 RepID=UPI003F527057
MTTLEHPGAPVEPTAASSVSADRDRPPSGLDGFRPDIEGLRAIAVTIVVLFHAGLPGLRGGYIGVDVFFVISGFLITGHLLREIGKTGTISLAKFYSRRALRLLPAASFVVVTTLAVAWLWLPPLRTKDIAMDALTTTFYGMNYRLAIQGTDYLGATAAPSPLQHFWSLAVEEQFYLIWPPLLLLLAFLTRRRAPHFRRRLLISFVAVVIAGSLAISVWQTEVSAPWAYFGLQTRAWELATGALVALLAQHLTRLPATVVSVGRLLALASMGVVAIAFSEATPFPGYAAAAPVAAAALLIAVGCTRAESQLLGSSIMQAIGKHSYSWYLWHWPVLIVGPFALGDLNVFESLALAGLSLLLAVITSRQIENPLRSHAWFRQRTVRAMTLTFSMTATVMALSLVVPTILPSTTGSGAATDAAGAVGANSQAELNLINLVKNSVKSRDVPANLQPPIARASTDVGRIYSDGCDPEFLESDVKKPCLYGETTSTKTMVLFGDSHAGHWFPALDAIAKRKRWRLAVVTKSACPAASVTVTMTALKRTYTECDTWRAAAFDYIASLKPQLVVTSSNSHSEALNVSGDQNNAWAQAWATTFKKVAGAKVVFISDTAWPQGNVPECVSNHVTSVTDCGRDRDAALGDARRRKLIAEAARQNDAVVVDPVKWMCTEDRCPVIIGNVLVYKDDSHISATYSKLVAPALEQRMSAAMKG